jgi:S1-C subfamily serine protease
VPEHDDEDAGASGPPPDPLDRVWLHPSELHSFLATSDSRPRPARRRNRVLAGLTAVAILAIATGVVVTLTGTFDTDSTAPLATGIDVFSSDRVPAEMVLIAGASIVTVHVARPDGITKASGVCIGDDTVLTSASALEGATGVAVMTSEDDRSLPAEAAGTDPQTDLALLQVDSLDVPPARLGSSENLREGEWVLGLAAGPRSRQHWVNIGSIGDFNRLFVTAAGTAVSGLIDTKTGAGRQHSGGVVLDRYGAVVGILTVPAGAAPSGLAVPIDLAREVVRELAATGTVTRAWLGVTGTDDTERTGGGAMVAEVAPSSPADDAGLVPGDVIIAIGEDQSTTLVSGISELLTEIRHRDPGSALELTVLRDGSQRHVPVELAEQTAPGGADTVATTTTTTTTATTVAVTSP